MPLTVKTEGRFDARMQLLNLAIRRGLTQAGNRMRFKLIENIEKVRPDAIATGQTWRSIRVSPVRIGNGPNGAFYYVRVGPRTGYSYWGIEHGRRPGTPPPWRAIMNWVREKPGGAALTDQQLYLITRAVVFKISQEGTTAYHLVSKTLAEERSEISKIIRASMMSAIGYGK